MSDLMYLAQIAESPLEEEIVECIRKSIKEHPQCLITRYNGHKMMYDRVHKSKRLSRHFIKNLSLFVSNYSDTVQIIKGESQWQ